MFTIFFYKRAYLRLVKKRIILIIIYFNFIFNFFRLIKWLFRFFFIVKGTVWAENDLTVIKDWLFWLFLYFRFFFHNLLQWSLRKRRFNEIRINNCWDTSNLGWNATDLRADSSCVSWGFGIQCRAAHHRFMKELHLQLLLRSLSVAFWKRNVVLIKWELSLIRVFIYPAEWLIQRKRTIF
jgi:hypothetical protein